MSTDPTDLDSLDARRRRVRGDQLRRDDVHVRVTPPPLPPGPATIDAGCVVCALDATTVPGWQVLDDVRIHDSRRAGRLEVVHESPVVETIPGAGGFVADLDDPAVRLAPFHWHHVTATPATFGHDRHTSRRAPWRGHRLDGWVCDRCQQHREHVGQVDGRCVLRALAAHVGAAVDDVNLTLRRRDLRAVTYAGRVLTARAAGDDDPAPTSEPFAGVTLETDDAPDDDGTVTRVAVRGMLAGLLDVEA